jgi:hypothetical protein
VRLSLIYEADMSRRDFLKLIGKAGAAAMGSPLQSLEPLINLVSRSTFTSSELEDELWRRIQPWKAASAYPASKINPEISNKMLKGFLAHKTKEYLDSNRPASLYYGIDYLRAVERTDKKGIFTNLASNLQDKMVQSAGPEAIVKAMLLPGKTMIKYRHSDVEGNFDYWIKWVDSVWDKHLEMLSQVVSTSPTMRSFMAQHGMSALDIKRLAQNKDASFEFFEKLNALSSEDVSTLKNAREGLKQKAKLEKETSKTAKEVETPVDELMPNSAHLEREVGYEKQGQFDPQSSRPAQALGPFESRLKDVLRSIL